MRISRWERGVKGESGQVMIFAALMILFVCLPVTGLVVEGGRVFVSYRQMQSAADMAALGGALKLSSGASAAITQACSLSFSNGFDNCATSGNTQTLVCVPPQTQSPYKAIDYGSSSNTGCNNKTGNFGYIEVRISKTLGTIPIFNVPVTLSAHAVARSGIPGIRDYAIAALDPGSVKGTLNFSTANGIIAVGAITDNSTNADSITTNGSGTNDYITCSASWFNTSSEPNSSIQQIGSNSTGHLQFAPPACAGGAFDNPTKYSPNAGSIADPYGSSTIPTGNMTVNCPGCENVITHYYQRSGTPSWQTIKSPQGIGINGNDVIELYPGIYSDPIQINGGTVYFNPGVYTFRGLLKITGANMCTYGAPVCGEQQTGFISNLGNTSTNCANASFKSGDPTFVSAGQWYYYCSPYGVYDTNSHGGFPPEIQATAPTFLDVSSGTPVTSSLKLNGVTFFMGCATSPCTKQKNDVDIEGGASMSLAAPNACLGNGHQTGFKVDFPDGANFNRIDTIPSAADGTSPAVDRSGGVQMYPNVNFLITGEPTCTTPALVWKGELGSSVLHQHLHFLLFAKNDDLSTGNTTGSGFTMTGGGQQNWWGILHTFPTYSGYPAPPAVSDPSSATGTDACSGCSVNAGGNAAASPNGPPFLTGQIIADSVSVAGNAVVEVFNRPSGAPNGPGSSLVQ